MSPNHLLSTGLNSGDATYGRIVGGEGVHFVLEDGRRLLDASNTGGPLGHGHPELVQAIRAAATSPVINEGWLWAEREEAARELVETAFAGEHEWVGAVRFFLSGSEANDLALSLAQALTGRVTLATRERAYHGMTGLARDVTVQPQWHGGLSSRRGSVRPVPPAAVVVELPRPRGARIGEDEAINALPADLDTRLEGVAAVILDYTQGGTYHSATYQDAVADAARAAGTLWIADEVVTGLGRTGSWFAFAEGQSRPDVVTLGKPLAGGAAPAGAVVLSKRVLAALEDEVWQTYSTFRGHPLVAAALRAHLRIVVRDGLVERARAADRLMLEGLREIARRHPSVARVDGRGLHWTIELHGPDWRDWHGVSEENPTASRVASRAIEAGVLIGTSGERTSLFLAPPLISTDEDLERILAALDHGLSAADEEMTGAPAPSPDEGRQP